MIIKILGTESLGVRGLSCSVELKNQKILIDPGIALGWSRYGFLPHPFQIAVGSAIRKKIIKELKDTTDVVISHFDGDHCPLYNPNPYQLGIEEVKSFLSNCRIWAQTPSNFLTRQKKRREEIARAIGRNLQNAEGINKGFLEFSLPVPHGRPDGKHMVMMSRIEEEGEVFVHASDIQFLDEKAIEIILNWEPDIVLASGPPFYLSSLLSQKQKEKAWQNTIKLSKNVDTLIIDHHILRGEKGIEWLEKLKHIAKNKVFYAADFMKREPLLLESWRKELYEWLPVPDDWHEGFSRGRTDFYEYRIKGWDTLIKNGKIKPCKWYYSCPIKEFTDQGKLERYWVENYCLVGSKNCVRYQMEEKGKYHPDNMLPDGQIIKYLR